MWRIYLVQWRVLDGRGKTYFGSDDGAVGRLENDFEDVAWVSVLMENFAEYYLRALEAYESKQTNLPATWQIAFNASHNTRTHVV